MSFVEIKKQIAAPEASLLLVNFLPIFGVFFLHWSIFIILFMYWLENVVVGLYNVLKLFLCETKTKDVPRNIAGLVGLGKTFIILFFMLHFGMFTLAHGIFVLILFYEPGLTMPSTHLQKTHVQSNPNFCTELSNVKRVLGSIAQVGFTFRE